MRNIDEIILEETSFEIFEKIIDGKQEPNKGVLNSIKNEIADCYIEYDTKKGDLFSLSHKGYTDENQSALLHCYNNDLKYTKNLKKEIKNLGNRKCPYCNIEHSVEVEHYIPKDEYPEFSFLIQNLIPSCGTCNKIKGAKWKDTKTRLFLNAFFDNIPKEQFLFIKLWVDDGIICSKFRIDVSGIIISSHLEVILNNHVKKLNLLDRYTESINEIIAELKYAKPESITDLKSILISHIRTSNGYGNNYWENILYKEISEKPEILDYIINNSPGKT